MIKLDKFLFKFVLVCAIGIILNLIGLNIAKHFNLPLYLDTTGTVFVAVLGGYVPGIAIGFASNVIGAGFNMNEMYFGIVNVSVAIFSTFLAARGYFRNFPKVLLVIPAMALMTSFLGGMIEEGLILSNAPNWTKFFTNIVEHVIDNLQTELPDKGFAVILSFLALKLVPHDLEENFERLGKMQAPVPKEIRRAMNAESNFLSSLSTKMIFTLMSVTFFAAFCISLISFALYRDNIVKEHIRIADGIITMAVNEINPKRVDEFIELGHQAQGYNDVERKLYAIRDLNSDVKYLYFYKIQEDGCHVVFDLSTASLQGSPPGDILDFDESFEPYKDALLAGRPIPPIISDETFGYLLTIYKPVYNSVGQCVCYAGLDFSMDSVNEYGKNFIVRVIALFSGVVVFIFALGMWFIENNIILPVNTMAYCAENFAYDSEEARELNIERMRSLDIRTRDEIENLYAAFLKTTTDSMHYFNNLRKAKIQVEVMNELAHTDSLTGIKNKMAYVETTAKLNNDIANGDAQFCIVMIDVNFLKKVNDTYGHERGNEYLINACRLACHSFGKDNVYRIGGDEFVAVLTGVNFDNRKNSVEELRKKIDDLRNDNSLEPWKKVSAAVGVSEYQSGDTDADTVFKRADEQMYRNKLAMKATRKD